MLTGAVVAIDPAIMSDIGVGKEVIGLPTLLANGNSEVYRQLVVGNNGVADLADVSLVEDLETLFGSKAFRGVRDLTLVTPPTNANSSIVLNLLGWDGTSATDLIDQSVTTNFLASGDSFVVGLKVEIDALAATGVLSNTAAVAGTVVNSADAPATDAAGKQVVVSNDSGGGGRPKTINASELRGVGGTSVPDPRSVPSVCLTKTASDAIANGDNWDVTFTLTLKNSGPVALDKVEIFDDLAAVFGGQFAGVTLDRVTSAPENTGAALIANSGFTADTTMSLVKSTGSVEVGDAFEVVFTVTIDPNVDGTAVSGLESQASAICEALDENGHSIVNLDRSSAISQADNNDNGIGLAAGNSDCEMDRAFADEPTPDLIADITVVKSVAGTPLRLTNGNFEVVYDLVIANTGAVDLAALTLVERLAGRFGSVLLSASNVTLATPPSEARSCVTLDSSWNGDSKSEMVDQAASTLLVVGDSFTVQFTVEVDPSAVGAPSKLENQAAVSGREVHAIEENLPISNDDEMLATDLSHTEASPKATNKDAPVTQGDQETSNAPLPLDLPNLSIGRAIVGEPVVTDLGNYVVTFQLLIENTGNVDLANLSLLEDLSSQFGRPLVKAGNLSITSNPTDTGSTVSVDSAGWNGKMSTELLDSFASNVLVAGDSFTVQFEVEINPRGGQANPENLVPIGILIDSFRASPGPIYSGNPINQNSNPLHLEKGPTGTRGYSISDGSIFAGV